MRVIFEHDRAAILHGDCRDLLQVLPERSVDAIVCDPPYLLANASGTGFMGREWDSVKLEDGETVGRASERWHLTWCAVALRVLKPGGHMLAFGGSRTFHRMCSAIEDVGFELRDVLMWMYGQGFPKSLDVSKAVDKSLGAQRAVVHEVTDRRDDGTGYGLGHNGALTSNEPITAAAAWHGWGTALKPSYEPICLARRPLDGTVAGNVLRWGAGGINVGGCRIGEEVRYNNPSGGSAGDGSVYGLGMRGKGEGTTAIGRWPANVVLDEEALSLLGEQSEQAPRFFYCAKPSRAEKELGLDHLPVKSGSEITGREEGSAGIQNPRAGAGARGGARNTHVTVKPVALMRYLCRLVTPPGGTVLDVFAGSGTTGVAALAEGLNFVGVEMGGDGDSHLPILLGRIRRALDLPAEHPVEEPR